MRVIDRAQKIFKITVELVPGSDYYTHYVWGPTAKIEKISIHYLEMSSKDLEAKVIEEVAFALSKDYRYVKEELCAE